MEILAQGNIEELRWEEYIKMLIDLNSDILNLK